MKGLRQNSGGRNRYYKDRRSSRYKVTRAGTLKILSHFNSFAIFVDPKQPYFLNYDCIPER
jgi:hypothetical protein